MMLLSDNDSLGALYAIGVLFMLQKYRPMPFP